jgi:predicted DNA-binding mobile mystery protein A
MFSRQRTVARQRLDARLTAFKASDLGAVPSKGWMRAVREALGMTAVQFARRMGVKPPSVTDMEHSEVHGTIQLKTLRKAAEALDCVLVYAVVPRTSLEETVEKRARALAVEQMGRIGHTMDLEAQGLSRNEREAQVETYIREHLRVRDLWNER